MPDIQCLVCGARNWDSMPDPVESASVTTSARIVPEPLGKSICRECGVVQRTGAPFLGTGSFYEEEYASYYERPGTERFHAKRYQQLVEWMGAHLHPQFEFERVLDVGCGQGWAMDAMASRYPGISVSGVEPSRHNSAIARAKGYEVIETKVGDADVRGKFDFIYSNNVLQHVNDPRGFLGDIAGLLNDDGVIMVTCPDGARPNIELFFCDHNFSFLPHNLSDIADTLGFRTVTWSSSRLNPALPPAQLLLLTNNRLYDDRASLVSYAGPRNIDASAIERRSYIDSVRRLREYLSEQTAGSAHVYNFGASFWTSVLAAYCPEYWWRVKGCLVDSRDSTVAFIDKPIVAVEEIPSNGEATIVLGTSPATHDSLIDRFADGDAKHRVLGWNSYFSY